MKNRILSFIKYIVVGGLTTLLVGCASSETETDTSTDASSSETIGNVDTSTTDSTKSVTIRVGYFGTAQYQTQLAIAKENGYFDEAFDGLDVTVEYSFFAGAGPAINEALLAGELDVAVGVGDQPTLSGISSGNGDVILSQIVKCVRSGGIVARNDISSIEELKGKKVACGVGTAGQKALDMIVKEYGLTEDDFEVVNLNDTDELIAATYSGNIDAFISFNIPYILNVAEENNLTVLCDMEACPNYAYLSANAQFLDENTEVMQKFVDALYEADVWYDSNVDEGNQIVANFLNLDVEDVSLVNSYSEIEMGLSDENYDNIELTYDFMKDNEILPNEIGDLNTIFNDSFINNAISNN